MYALARSLLQDDHLANDVVQEANLALWAKRGEFDAERDFLPWAYTFLKNQVRAAFSKRSRGRMIFDDDVVQKLADCLVNQNSNGQRAEALEACLEMQGKQQSQLVKDWYESKVTRDDLAKSLGMSMNALSVQLHRIRVALRDCIQHRLKADRS